MPKRSADARQPVKVDGRSTRSTRSESLVEQVRKQILEGIIQGKTRPGTLMQLGELANSYGVSRTPVREALAHLERQGLVTGVPYKGYLVRGIEPGDVHDIYLLRSTIEGVAAELAATRIRPEVLRRLRKSLPARSERMTLEYDAHTHGFHRLILEAAGSPRLLAVFEEVYNDVRRVQYAGIGNPRPDLIHAEHQVIADALEAGDGSAARKAMEEHLKAISTRTLQSWVEGAT